MTSANQFEFFTVRFTGKNYSSWEFQFQLFVTAKALWGHIDGSTPAPSEPTELSQWKIKDAQVMTWILGSVEPLIVTSLRPYKTAAGMWQYLKRVYNRENSARRFQLEHDIANYSQGQMSVHEYFSGFQNLWADFTDIIYAKVPAATLPILQEIYEQSKRDQLLMKLKPEFEALRSTLMSRVPTPSLDDCLGELLREEQRLLTQSTLTNENAVSVAYAAPGIHRERDTKRVQCYHCKEFGHIATNCPKKSCRYCKQPGHFVRDCTTRPPQRKQYVQRSRYDAATAITTSTPQQQAVLTPAMVQDMIISAFTALGLQGKNASPNELWLVDSGASNHMTNSATMMRNIRAYNGSKEIQVANGSKIQIAMTGDLTSYLRNVFIAPKLATRLISVGQLVDNNCYVTFSRDGCHVQDQATGTVLAKGPKVGRLFPLRFPISSNSSLCLSTMTCNNSIWHKRLGHPNSNVLSHLLNSGLLGNKQYFSTRSLECSACKIGKSQTLPFPSQGSRAEKCFDIIHSDVWGITPVVSHANYKYFVTFIDDYSRYTWVYFLRSKSEVFSSFKDFLAYVETQFSARIKHLRTDSGGEYMSKEFHSFLKTKGIVSQRSCPYTPQQNGLAERKNRHLLNVTRTLLLESSVPPRFWVEALATAVYLINRLPTPVLNLESPHYRLHQDHPTYQDLHPFGCVCFVHLPSPERDKLSAQAVKCAFMGYSVTQKGFICYDPISNKIRISRNVVFFENQYLFPLHKGSDSTSSVMPIFSNISVPPVKFKPGFVYKRRPPLLPLPAPVPPPVPDPPVAIAEDPGDATSAPSLRHSGRISRPPDRYGFSAQLTPTSVPSCYSQAAKMQCWQQAMQDELKALKENHTWDIVPCSSSIKPIGCKWVYSVKLLSDGSLHRYKARLVALGNRQEFGVDYEETFAPVAKMTTIRTIMAIAASHHWPLLQMDVTNAFLHGDLHEDIYMKPPPGLQVPASTMCKLRKSLYGLKQAPRAWFAKFRSTLLRFSFAQSQYDSSLFLSKTNHGMVFLLVYVDDIVITGTDASLMEELKTYLQASFHMKDLGTLSYFLGLEVTYDVTGIFLNQRKYIRDLIDLAGLHDSTPVDTPLEINVKYSQDDGELLLEPTIFRQLVGSLNYLTITRPDISFAVQQVSQFMHAPRHLHLVAARRIIKYLLGTSDRGLFYSATSKPLLTAYSDADWAGCPDTRRSVTGWCMFLGDSLIAWKSKKQDRVSKSSTESEYRAMSAACSEIVWLRGLLEELGFSQTSPTPLHADNTSAIQIAANPVFHERTKHIEVDCHSIREALENGRISLPHISSALQTADIFTKSLSRQRHQYLAGKLMLLDKPASI